MATYSPDSIGITAPADGFKDLGWYNARQYFQGSLSEPGQIHPNSSQVGAGQSVSPEVVRQSSPTNQQYIDAQKLSAPASVPYVTSTQSSFFDGLKTEVDTARTALTSRLTADNTRLETQMAEARAREQSALDSIKPLTAPFRQEVSEKYQPIIDQQFNDQIGLTDQLQTLLNEGQELIRRQQSVTGLDSVRNPRIQRSMNEVAAQAGIIQAVLAQKSANIATAYTIIDKTVGYINDDRQQQISYYNTILNLSNRDILMIDDKQKEIAREEIALLKSDVVRSQAAMDAVKNLMINPDTAVLMAKAGVTLNDTPEQINAKLAYAQNSIEVQQQANEITRQGGTVVTSPAGIAPDKLRSFTDSFGNTYYYKMPSPSKSTSWTNDPLTNDLLKELSSSALSVPTSTTSSGPLRIGANGIVSQPSGLQSLSPSWQKIFDTINPSLR